MRPDQAFMADILDNTELILGFVAGVSREAFHQDAMRKMAVEKGIERIGEAMKNISEDIKNRYPQVDWSGYARMRDRTTHGYWSVDYDIVWDTATQEIPDLREQVVQILAQEFSSHN
jgi:uncharacterized protein with HEPN domain